MTVCHELRSTLSRMAEGEAAPDEGLRLARHVPDCTACRILLAREKHLARMLDALDDLIPVEDAFLEGVMQSLPPGPPPRRRSRQGLKLAGIGAVLLAGGAGLARVASWEPGSLVRVPRFALPRMDNLLEALATMSRFVWMVLDRAGDRAIPDMLNLHVYARIGLAAFIPATVALLLLTTLFALFVRAQDRS
jgi:hypothetical protein